MWVLFSTTHTGFAEHVIKCAKRRRKKNIKSQRRISKNGTIVPKAVVKIEQKSSSDQTLGGCHMMQEKLSSPMKQEIRSLYRLKVAKPDTNSEDDSCSPNKKSVTSSPMTSSTAEGCNESTQNNSKAVRRKLTFLSERQSEISPTIGVPNPPPCTPDNPGTNEQYL